MVQHVIERLGEVRGPNYDFQSCEIFRNLIHHIGHENSWRPCRKSATCGTLTAFSMTLCRGIHEGVEACSGLDNRAPKMILLVMISIPMKSRRPGRKSATLVMLPTFWLTVCKRLHEGAEACSDLGLHEVHAALELNSYLMKLMKTFWTKTNPPPSKKAVSRRRLEEVKQQRSGKKISKSSLPCRTRGTCVRLRKTT